MLSYTMAPEVLKGKYTKSADLWSIGVITYMLLSSQMPFFGRKRQHIVEQIVKGTYEFKGRRWKKLSEQSKAFVQDLMVVDPQDRSTAEDALGASWLNRRFSASVRNPHDEEMEKAQQSLVKYAGYSKLKRVALMVIAHKSTSQEIGILRKIFQKYDTKRDGQLSFEEFKAAIAESGISESKHQEIFDAVVSIPCFTSLRLLVFRDTATVTANRTRPCSYTLCSL
jgi:serine/threonine protein kinase